MLNLETLVHLVAGTPPAMLSAWSRRWLWGDALCDVEGFTVYFLGMASMYVLMAIAFDRYIAISKPLLGTKITKTVAFVSCGKYGPARPASVPRFLCCLRKL